MGGFWIIVIIAFILNRIFGFYKDETTQRILEEAGALPPSKPRSRTGATSKTRCCGVKRTKRPQPFDQMALRKLQRTMARKSFNGLAFCKMIH